MAATPVQITATNPATPAAATPNGKLRAIAEAFTASMLTLNVSAAPAACTSCSTRVRSAARGRPAAAPAETEAGGDSGIDQKDPEPAQKNQEKALKALDEARKHKLMAAAHVHVFCLPAAASPSAQIEVESTANSVAAQTRRIMRYGFIVDFSKTDGPGTSSFALLDLESSANSIG
jgi:hypothetical protein